MKQHTEENAVSIYALEQKLLGWYDVHQRTLPWRAVPGYATNPYHVWLSEIMLQQTTVATVKDYFVRFIDRWPTLEDLATGTLDEVFHAWQGLGYYSRARNLHSCAQVLVNIFKGVVPQEEEVLLTLPGIGPYTAAAIASIAYDQPTIPVDGNIVRVFSRLLSLSTPLPMVKQEIQTLVKKMVPTHRSGDFAQSLMDLGATVCRPRNPSCQICPLQTMCKGWADGVASQLPYPAIKEAKPRRYGVAFWVENKNHEILLEKRPEKGLLAGLIGLPTTEWREKPWDGLNEEAIKYAPEGVNTLEPLPVIIRHTFTHFHLELRIAKGIIKTNTHGFWSSLDKLDRHALPTVMKKVIQSVVEFGDLSSSK